jgi:hypothetical protein
VPEIDALGLDVDVAQKALQLKLRAPGVVFTSGRRTLRQQARAMAGNVTQNRDWIVETYRPSEPIRQMQKWVDDHPEAETAEAVAKGLEAVMSALPPEECLRISRHLVGRAFDVRPGSAPECEIEALEPRQFLTMEGGLVIWHVGF